MTISTYSELVTALQNWEEDTEIITSARAAEYVALCESRLALDLRIRAMEKQAELLAYATETASAVGGSANAITLTMPTTVTSLTKGTTVKFTATASNTGATTLQVDATAATSYREDDASATMSGGEIISGQDYRAYYDGTYWRKIEAGQVPLPTRYISARSVIVPGIENPTLSYRTPEQFEIEGYGYNSGRPKVFTISGEFIKLGPVSDGSYVAKLLYYQRFAALSGSSTNWLLTNHSGAYLYASLLEAAIMTENDAAAAKYAKLYSDIVDRINAADMRDRFAGPSPSARSIYTVP